MNQATNLRYYPHNSKDTQISITTARELIEWDRYRFKKCGCEPIYGLKHWGENFNKTAEEIFKEYWKRETCQVCGKKIDNIDESYQLLEFSFCAEYSCGLAICIECMKQDIWNDNIKWCKECGRQEKYCVCKL